MTSLEDQVAARLPLCFHFGKELAVWMSLASSLSNWQSKTRRQIKEICRGFNILSGRFKLAFCLRDRQTDGRAIARYLPVCQIERTRPANLLLAAAKMIHVTQRL